MEGPPETWEEIQVAHKREEAGRLCRSWSHTARTDHHWYEEELRALRAQIEALHCECEVRVNRVRRKWERDWAIERGEVAVVAEEEEETGERGRKMDGLRPERRGHTESIWVALVRS